MFHAKIKNCLGVLAAVVILVASGSVMARETTSAIRGKVVDSNGQSMANAEIVVLDERTGIERTFTANDSGTFLAARLPVGGPYKVTVNGRRSLTVESLALGDTYNLTIDMKTSSMEEVVVYGKTSGFIDVAAGPSASFSQYDMDNAVSFDRDINEAFSIDPRISLDQSGGGGVNCAGKHPRFNSVLLDGVSQNDRFGLNGNGYSTAVGMPFPYDAIAQVSVELAPFDVSYGGFSACVINAVTKSGTNEWEGYVFFEHTNESLRGDSIDGVGFFPSEPYTESRVGFNFGGPLIKDKLFFYGAYEESDEPRFIAQGFDGSQNGTERDWLSESDLTRISDIAQNLYGYDPGGQPSDGVQEQKKYMARIDWSINENHNLSAIYNYYDGFQDRSSDGDQNEFEFANHFYVKGSESETTTLKLSSQWNDALSTEFFYSQNTMDDSQVTTGPADFGDFQISLGRDTVYLGADDSRQANALNTESEFFRGVATYLVGDHVITAGFESEELTIFNQFVQHARGGEWDFFDGSGNNSDACGVLDAAGRFADASCGLSGIDKFELGRPSRVFYGSGGGTNDAADAAASFNTTQLSFYIQDEYYMADYGVTVVGGVRYDVFQSDDRPNFNQAFTTANNGLRNDENVDGLSILMPRLGITWDARDDLTVRGGIGLFSGGNPNVWISNAFSNDGFTNVQTTTDDRAFGERDAYRDSTVSVFDGTIALNGPNPGFAVPQSLFDRVGNATPANASETGLVLLDPNYEQPSDLKIALGATYDLPWGGITADADYLFSRSKDSAIYVDVAQTQTGTTLAGTPIYSDTTGSRNLMLTNASVDADTHVLSLVLKKEFDFGLDLLAGYSYTDAEDVSPMTSSTAGSNFSNVATNDPQNPGVGPSNYFVPHRFTARAVYGKELIGNLRTSVSLYGQASEGQPQSYVMGSQDQESDGRNGRHLLYVPNGPTDPNVVYDAGFDQAAFANFVNREGLGAGFVGRNAQHARWSYRLDLRVDQELPTFIEGTSGRVFFKMYNLTNFLNDDWGQANDAQFFSVQMVESSVNDAGQFVFEEFNDLSIEDIIETRSLWEARVGVQFNF
jgi:outer membrane receptor for ferrienterochelin and colicin